MFHSAGGKYSTQRNTSHVKNALQNLKPWNAAQEQTSHVKNALHNLKPWNAAQEQSSLRQLPPQTLKSQYVIFKNYQRKQKIQKQNAKSLSKMRLLRYAEANYSQKYIPVQNTLPSLV